VGTIILGAVILLVAFVVRTAGSSLRTAGGRASGALVNLVSLGLLVLGLLILTSSSVVVIDAGAEFAGYATDITRTIPVSGKFTPRQKAIYELVLGSQQAAIDSVRPGITLRQLDQISRRYMAEHSGDLCGAGGCVKYYIHGLSHWIGMDVHDVGGSLPLAVGMAFTVEPGIYIPDEALGVRIEDDVLVTPAGPVILSKGAPKTVAEIEKLMAQRR